MEQRHLELHMNRSCAAPQSRRNLASPQPSAMPEGIADLLLPSALQASFSPSLESFVESTLTGRRLNQMEVSGG